MRFRSPWNGRCGSHLRRSEAPSPSAIATTVATLESTVSSSLQGIHALGSLTPLSLLPENQPVFALDNWRAMASRALYTVGFWIRETGQALDRAGCRLQGKYFFREELTRHRPLMNLFDKKPDVAEDAFVAPSASLVGDVQVGSKSSIWYGCVLRGDTNSIRVGSETNIQDHSLVTVGGSRFIGGNASTVIGNKVTIGHGAVIHSCTVEDGAFVGMGATLLDGVVVEEGAFVAAGALVSENTRIPAGQIWAGNPAKLLRELKGDEGAFIPKSADHYSELAAAHAEANAKSFQDLTTVPEVKIEENSPELTQASQ